LEERCLAMARITSSQRYAAELLADGHSHKEVSEMLDISITTLNRWIRNPDFQSLVDELTVASGLAQKAERIRIAKQVVKQKMQSDRWSKKDLLDWLEFIRDETTEANSAVNINLLVANTFNSLPPESRPAAYLELARSFFKGSGGPGSFGISSQNSPVSDEEGEQNGRSSAGPDGSED